MKYMHTIGLQIAGLYCQPIFSQFSKAKTSKGHFQSQIDHSTQGKPLKKASRRPREQNASLCSGRVHTQDGWETPCSMCAMSRLPCPRSQLPCTRSHLPCPSFYLPEYTSHSDWLHHNNLIYIVILNYILSSEQQNRLGIGWVSVAWRRAQTPLTASRPATEGWRAVSRHHLR